MTRGESTVRWISPHALGFDSFRWHIRAYCHTHNDFRDFLFSRISSIVSERQSTMDGLLDTAWNHNVVVKIGPHPLLSDDKKRAVEIDYEMTNGVASIETRAALLFYLLKRLGLLDAIQEQKPPETQHIVLLNRQEVEAALKENDTAYQPTSSSP
jgi:predicted DNA-binding transcriptional regulator YafY